MIHRPPRSLQAGFTLLEMLVVLVILGLVVGLVVARGPSRSPRLELQTSASRLAQTMRLARTRAIATNHATTVVVDVANHRFAMDGGPVILLPATVAMAAVTVAGSAAGNKAAFTFEPDGSASGGRVDLASGALLLRVSIDWLTGRISVADAH